MHKFENWKSSQAITQNLYFLGIYKSLRVVSTFMDLEWCRREKNQIPPRSARTDKEFGLITFFVFKLLSHKLSSDPSAWFSILLENEYFENPENQPKWLASLLILNELLKKMGATKIFVSLSRSSWCTSFLMKTRFKESYCKWSKAIICDRKKCLYFLGLYKSLRVVSKFMHLEWCRRETNQIPRRSAQTDEEFGLITFFDFKLLSHKLSSDVINWLIEASKTFLFLAIENDYFKSKILIAILHI